MPTLYLIPSPIGESFRLPELVQELRMFVVENLRDTRRFLRWNFPDFPIDDCQFLEINKNALDQAAISRFLDICTKQKASLGLFSDAGLPCVADPGNSVVELAHKKEFRVKPLSGPSSLMLALMASGFNGQAFSFHGYLPIQEAEQIKRIKQLEEESRRFNRTQLFIETPYRNEKLLEQLVKNVSAQTRICIAADLDTPEEEIHSLTAQEWKHKLVKLHKRPCVFLLYAGS